MTQEKNTTAQDLWDEADALFDNDNELPASPYMHNATRQDPNEMLMPSPSPLSPEALQDDEKNTSSSPVKPTNIDLPPVPDDVWDDSEELNAKAPLPTPSMTSDDINRESVDKREIKKNRSVNNSPLPVTEGGFIKAKKYRSSIKAFYPHLIIAALAVIVALFPSLGELIFSDEDLAKLPEWLRENFHLLVKVISGLVALLLVVVVIKQKSSGVIKVYGDYLEYKKGLLNSTTIHYADIRTIDVQRCLASMYAPIGDLHIISNRDHIIMPNLLDPFRLKTAIEQRRSELLAR